MNLQPRRWRMLSAMLLVAAVVAVGCSSGNTDDSSTATAEPSGSVTLLSPAEYQSAIAGNDVFVVNVHIPYEGEIAATDALIPFDEVADFAEDLPEDKSMPLYIYCRTGRMSGEATPVLQRMGYTNIIDLEGGMQAWEAAGLPLIVREDVPAG